MRASRNLHNTMFQGVSRARMYFFHTNPSGRILNRFSKDMGQVDELLPAVMIDVMQIFLQLFGIIVVIVVVNYYFIVPTLVNVEKNGTKSNELFQSQHSSKIYFPILNPTGSRRNFLLFTWLLFVSFTEYQKIGGSQ